jgi:hypothetical protein
MLLSLFSSFCRTKNNIQKVKDIVQWCRKEHVMRNLYLMEYSGGCRKEIFLKRIDNGAVKKCPQDKYEDIFLTKI